jgi:hypothetical protein
MCRSFGSGVLSVFRKLFDYGGSVGSQAVD